jgi:hypothetical protein
MNLQMSGPAIIAFSLGCAAALSANLISWRMIGMINAEVPEAERVSYVLWGGEVRPRFKRLFPTSRLVLFLDASVVAMLFSFVALARLWVFA